MNPATVSLRGYSEPQELIGCNRTETVYANSEERIILQQELLEFGQVSNYELTFNRKNGELMFVVCNIRLIRSEAGEPELTEGVFVDITERITSEVARSIEQAAQRKDLKGIREHLENLEDLIERVRPIVS